VGWPEFLGNLSESEKRDKPYILLIDDDDQILESLNDFLTHCGFQVFLAHDGTSGLQSYYSNNPDLVITDLNMPGISGLKLLEKIREHKLETEIVILTGHGELNDAVEALRYHAFEFLLKPVDLKLLDLTIKNALRRTRDKRFAKRKLDELEHDVSELKTSQKELFRISGNSPHALIAYDKAGKIQFWNQKAEKITGYSAAEAFGKTLKKMLVVTESLVKPQMDPDSNLQENVVSQIMTKAQQLRYISRFANVLYDDERKVVGGIESFIDVTDTLESDRLQNKHLLQVRTINEIGKKIAASISITELTDYICQNLFRTFFESSQISVSLYDKSRKQLALKATAGNYTDTVKEWIGLENPVSNEKSAVFQAFQNGETNSVHQDNGSKTEAGSILKEAQSAHVFPIRSTDTIYGVLSIENKERMNLDISDISMLETIAEYIAITTERIGLLGKITNQNVVLKSQATDLKEALTEQEKQKNIIEEQNQQFMEELTKAGEFQKSLLPEDFPDIQEVSFSASYIPSNQLGGDFFDVFELGKDKIGFVIADASGHGVTAAMLSAMFKMTFHKYASAKMSPSDVLNSLNNDFCKVLQMGEFFTAFYAIYNYKTGVLAYCNAAHPYPLLINHSNLDIMELSSDGFLLGVMDEGIAFETRKLTIKELSRLIIFTDGITESANPSGKLYGDIRIKNDLKNLRNLPAGDFLSIIEKDVTGFTGIDFFEDDITMLVVDFKREQ